MVEVRARSSRALVALLLLLSLVGAAGIPAAAGPDEELERVDERRERVERRLERVRAIGEHLATRLNALDRRRETVETALVRLRARIDALDAEVEVVEKRLLQAQGLLDTLALRLRALQSRLTDRETLYHERAIDTYMTGPTGALDTLFSSGSLADLLDRTAYYEAALDADAVLLDEIERLEDEAIAKRTLLEDKRDQIASDKARLQGRRRDLDRVRDRHADALAARQAAIARKKELLAGVRSREGKLEDAERQLAHESARIGALLSGGSAIPPGGGELSWPANGPVTSGFGYRTHPILGGRRLHAGVDIGAPYGAAVWAAASGRVAYSGLMSGYGNVVIIDHGGGLATTYAHLSSSAVGSGQAVARGQVIAAVGCTGYCTGPHLHFEVRINGEPVDPMPYLH